MLPTRLSLLALLGSLTLTVAASDSLYQRLGGEPAMQAIATEVLDLSAADPQTSRSLRKVNMPRLKQLLAEQLCMLSGGPCRYSGDSMRESHAGLGISEAEFYGMVEHLRAVLDARGVAQADKNALLAILAPMKRDIVEKQP